MGRSQAKCPLTALRRADDPLRVVLNVWIDPLLQHLCRFRHITAVTWASVCQQPHLTIYTHNTHILQMKIGIRNQNVFLLSFKIVIIKVILYMFINLKWYKLTPQNNTEFIISIADSYCFACVRLFSLQRGVTSWIMMSLRNWLLLKEYYQHFPHFSLCFQNMYFNMVILYFLVSCKPTILICS